MLKEFKNAIETLSETGNYRSSLYLNEKVIDSYYSQMLIGISQLSTNNQIEGNIKASLNILFSSIEGGVGKTKGISYEIDINYIKKVMLVEFYLSNKNKLIDLSKDISSTTKLKQDLLIYFGNGKIVDSIDEVYPKTTDFTDKSCNKIRELAQQQERFVKYENEKFFSIVLTAAIQNYNLVSIGSSKWIDMSNFRRYHKISPFGILGKYEQEIDDILFIQPFWIWH